MFAKLIEVLKKGLNGFLCETKKKQNFTKEDPENCVISCANELDTSEFDVFRLAYEWWYGKKANEKYIESLFGEYLDEGIVPHFVTHFARNFPRERNVFS